MWRQVAICGELFLLGSWLYAIFRGRGVVVEGYKSVAVRGVWERVMKRR